MKKEYVNIGRLQFLKDCAKGVSLKRFTESFAHLEQYGLDFEKAFVILGGKIESKKVFKKQKD